MYDRQQRKRQTSRTHAGKNVKQKMMMMMMMMMYAMRIRLRHWHYIVVIIIITIRHHHHHHHLLQQDQPNIRPITNSSPVLHSFSLSRLVPHVFNDARLTSRTPTDSLRAFATSLRVLTVFCFLNKLFVILVRYTKLQLGV